MESNQNSELDILKNNVVTHLFVNQADEDYILARFAYHNSMVRSFFSGAGQALEKYLKASLLLNGHSSKRYRHDLVKLFDKVASYAGDLLPKMLGRPEALDEMHWREETPRNFLTRIEPYVSPHNRYNLFGHQAHFEDLFHLDQLVFSLRRLSFNLDAYPFLGPPKQRDDGWQTVREALSRCPNYSPRGPIPKLSGLIDRGNDDQLRFAALNSNFCFAPDDYQHDMRNVNKRFSFASSVLHRRIIQPADKKRPGFGSVEAAELADWAVRNIVLQQDVKEELIDAAEKLRGGD